jgi:hypothetical protein
MVIFHFIVVIAMGGNRTATVGVEASSYNITDVVVKVCYDQDKKSVGV